MFRLHFYIDIRYIPLAPKVPAQAGSAQSIVRSMVQNSVLSILADFTCFIVFTGHLHGFIFTFYCILLYYHVILIFVNTAL